MKTFINAGSITALFLAIFTASAVSLTTVRADTAGPGLGCILATPDQIAAMPKAIAPALSGPLPASVDWSGEYPPPGNQGTQGSCTAWAVAYADKSMHEGQARGWSLSTADHQFSPAYVYNQINGGADNGSFISDAMQLMVSQGCCTLQSMPYNQANCTTQPNAVQKAEAQNYKEGGWAQLASTNAKNGAIPLNAIKEYLAGDDGVVLSIPIYHNFWTSKSPYFDEVGTYEGGHAICLVGYDDNLSMPDGTVGAFKFINSWGTNWGAGGFGYIPYSYMIKDAGPSTSGNFVAYVMTKNTVAAASVALNKTTASIPAGSSDTLVAAITPSNANQATTWTSSNTNVATVANNGVVSAVSPGTATITVKTVYGGRTARCTVTVTAAVAITYAQAFPDANFRAWVLNWIGGGRTATSPVTDADKAAMAALTKMDVSNRNIVDLTGIEYFTGLTTLDCSFNQLASLDVSKNTALTILFCYYNQLTSLDVSRNIALTQLYCAYNQLTSFDVTKNIELQALDCDSNQLTSFDVTKNTALTWLVCSVNQLTSLDVTKNTALTTLDCSNNQLTSLDVTKNTAMIEFGCGVNQLTSLNVSNNTALTKLYCSSNQLTSLDVSKNTALTMLWCDSNQLTSLDVSKNITLTQLYCHNNYMASPDSVIGWRNYFPDPPGPGTYGDPYTVPQFIFYPQYPPAYTVTYDANGGTGAPDPQPIIKAGNSATIPSTVPTRPGYDFLGWSASSTATTAGYQPGGSFTPSGNTTLYAVWKPSAPVTVPTLTVGNAAGRPGNTVTVQITSSNSPLLAGMEFNLNFPSSVLTLTDWSLPSGSGFSCEMTNINSRVRFSLTPSGTSTVNPNGVVLTLTFKIAGGAQPGSYDITLSDLFASDENDSSVVFTSIPGTVTVNNFLYGDFTGNGRVDATDVLWVQRYIASGRDLSAMLTNFPTSIDTFYELAADFTNNGRADATDVLWVQRYIASGRDPAAMLANFPTTIDFSHLMQNAVTPASAPAAYLSDMISAPGGGVSTDPSAGNTITLTPSATTIPAGSTFKVTVSQTTSTPIAGVEFDVNYDPGIIRLDSAASASGKVSVVSAGNHVSIVTSGTDPVGDGALAVLTFTVLDDSRAAAITLGDIYASDQSDYRVVYSVEPITVNVPIVTRTVTFDPNGGVLNSPAAITVNDGDKAMQPADPKRAGYTFTGWFLGGTAYNFNTPVTANITLAAQWTPVGPVVPPTSITMSAAQSSLNMKAGAKLQLQVTVSPAGADPNVTWSSSNPAVATVDPVTGLVTALKTGSVRITVKSNVDPTVSYMFLVMINA